MTEEIRVESIDEALNIVAIDACTKVEEMTDGTDEKSKEVKNLETIIKLQNERDRLALDKAKYELEVVKAEADKKQKNKEFWTNVGLTAGQIGAYCGMGLLTLKAGIEYGRMPNDGEKFFAKLLNLIKPKK